MLLAYHPPNPLSDFQHEATPRSTMSQYPNQNHGVYYQSPAPQLYQPNPHYPHLVVSEHQPRHPSTEYGQPESSHTQPSMSPSYSTAESTPSPIRVGPHQAAAQANAQHHAAMQQQQQHLDFLRQQQQHGQGHGQVQTHAIPPPRPSVNTDVMRPGMMPMLQPITGISPGPSYNPHIRRASSPAASYHQTAMMYPSSAYSRPVHALQQHTSDYGSYQAQQYPSDPNANGDIVSAASSSGYYYPNPVSTSGWQSSAGFSSGVRMGMAGLPPHVVRHSTGLEEMEQAEEEFSGMIYDPYQVKHRKRTTPEQLSVLEQAFDENNKPSAMSRKQMAERIGMTARSVQVWFQNRRQKRKALDKKRIEEEGQDTDEGSMTPGGGHAQSWMSHGNGAPLPHGSSNATGSSGEASPDLPPQQASWTSMPPPALPQQMVYPGQYGVPNPMYPPVHQQQYPQQRPTSSSGQSYSGVQRGIPSISQARRGSLPYPAPEMVQAGQTARALSGSGVAVPVQRSHIPMHMAFTINNGRRASLPVNAPINSRSSSIGPFTPPRTGAGNLNPGMMPMHGAGRELSSIQDHEERAHAGYGHIDTNVPSALQQVSALAPSAVNSSLASSVPSGDVAEQALSLGPLPNPGFSFGNINAAQAGNLQDNVSPTQSQGTASPLEQHPNYNFYVARNRMGSMASILSNVTDATTTDGSASDWEPQVVMPFMYSQYPGQQIQPPLVAAELEGDKMLYPSGLAGPGAVSWGIYGDRRASAPPDLLQKFETLDVEHGQHLPGAQMRRSPLNTSYVVQEAADGRTPKEETVSPRAPKPRSLTESEGGEEVATIMDPRRRIKAEDSETISNADRTPEAEDRLATASPYSNHTADPSTGTATKADNIWSVGDNHNGATTSENGGDFHFGVDFQAENEFEGNASAWPISPSLDLGDGARHFPVE